MFLPQIGKTGNGFYPNLCSVYYSENFFRGIYLYAITLAA